MKSQSDFFPTNHNIYDYIFYDYCLTLGLFPLLQINANIKDHLI